MRVAYLGNFDPEHSTENHLAAAFEANGHPVVRIQESRVAPHAVPAAAAGSDLFLWTQTLGHANNVGSRDHRAAMLLVIRQKLGLPTVSYHLDLWHGLDRVHQIRDEPFFRTDLVVTADGGNDEGWELAGVNHVWMPPGVSAYECRPGIYRPELVSELAFVGSWQGGYHPESSHRHALVQWLRENYGDRCAFWPKKGEPAVRGSALRDLYASVKVVVGDSCLVPVLPRYISDRVPETIGRGAFLAHPIVEGVTDGSLYEPGVHMEAWHAGDWSALRDLIELALADDGYRAAVATTGREYVLENHTYEVRVRELLALLAERGMVR